MDDYVWLINPIHQNRLGGFKKDGGFDNPVIKDSVKFSFDGAIMAVLRNKVESHYKSQKVHLIRHGYERLPKDIKVDDEESFFKYLAYFVDIE